MDAADIFGVPDSTVLTTPGLEDSQKVIKASIRKGTQKYVVAVVVRLKGSEVVYVTEL